MGETCQWYASSRKRLLRMLIIVLMIVVLFSSFLWYGDWLAEKELNKRLERAANFLLIQYTPFLKLCSESPTYFPHRYWLVSDNLWASTALEIYYPNISQTIKTTLRELAVIYSLPKNKDGLPISYKHEAVIGETVSIPFHDSILYVLKNWTLENSNVLLGTEIANGTIVREGWQGFADLLLYASLSHHYENNRTGAVIFFDKAKAMWDGRGLNDTATKDTGRYATYKLALLLYASRILKRQLSFKTKLESVLWFMQRESDGGMVTDYGFVGASIVRIGDANTETTSLTIIAYTCSPEKST